MTDYETLTNLTGEFAKKSLEWRSAKEDEDRKYKEYAQAKQDWIIANFEALETGKLKIGIYKVKQERDLFDKKLAKDTAATIRSLKANELDVARENLNSYKKMMNLN